MTNPVRINLALVQMVSDESPSSNLSQIMGLLNSVDTNALDWICLPENSLYNKIKNSSLGMSLADPEILLLQKYSDDNQVCFHLGAIPLKELGGVYNATVILLPDQPPQVVYRKIHLFDMEMGAVKVKESDSFLAGSEPATFHWRGWTFGFSICYDLRFSELFLYYFYQNVDVLFAPSAFTKVTGKSHWRALVQGRAIENQCFVVAAAQAGTAQWQKFSRQSYGHSMVVGPWGKVLVELPQPQPGLEIVTLEKSQVLKTRSILPVADHRKIKIKFDT